MMSESFYIQQAESCQRAAEDTPLANQRETLLRSRAAWLTLAAREQAIRAARAQREREKEQADE